MCKRTQNLYYVNVRRVCIHTYMHTRKLTHSLSIAQAIVSKLKTDLQKRLENPDDVLLDGEIPDNLKTLVLQRIESSTKQETQTYTTQFTSKVKKTTKMQKSTFLILDRQNQK